MNDTKLTTFDPAKTYVDPYGRRWTPSDMADRWDTESLPFRFAASDLLGLYPDLREHVPQWYEGAVAKGWVWSTEDNRLVRVSSTGDLLILAEGEGHVYWLWANRKTSAVEKGTLDDCLAAAEELVWKGVAS